MGDKATIEAISDLSTALVAALASTTDFYTEVELPPDSAASDTWERPVFKAPFACTIEEIVVVPITIVGQATNYMTLDCQNKGAAGSGTDSIGSLAASNATTNAITAMVGRDLVTTDADISSDHVVTLKKTVTSSGQAFPGGLVRVKYTRQ